MRFFRARRTGVRMGFALAATLFGLALSAGASEPLDSFPDSAPEPRGELTLGSAVAAALARNPDLAASTYELTAADARIEQARLRPNPQLSVELENFAGTGEARGIGILESTLSLSQVIEMGGKRALRTEVARSDRDVAGIARQAQQLDVLADVTRRYIDLVAARDRLALATRTRGILNKTLDAINARVKAARSPEAERSRAQIALTRAEVEMQQAESELKSARLALAALWGSTRAQFTDVRANLLELGPIKPFETLIEQLDRNPDFVRFASEKRLREAEVRLARAQARPNLTLGLGVRRLDVTNDHALVASFSMPLPLFDRNQGAIREAEVRSQQTEASRRAEFLRARATVFGLYQEFVATRTRIETLRDRAIPQAQQALAQTQTGYERGRFSYLELATAQQEELALQSAIIEAAADAHRVLTEIERVTGEPLATDSP